MISNNMFAYCLNDPINNVDPNGDFSIPLSKLNQFMLLGGSGGNGRLSGGYYDSSAYNTYAIRSATAAYDAALGGYYSGGVSSAITNPGAYVVSGAVSVTDDVAVVSNKAKNEIYNFKGKKNQRYIAKRGWDEEKIDSAIRNGKCGISINMANGKSCTVYRYPGYNNQYIVIENDTLTIVQASNLYDPKWIPDPRIVWIP